MMQPSSDVYFLHSDARDVGLWDMWGDSDVLGAIALLSTRSDPANLYKAPFEQASLDDYIDIYGKCFNMCTGTSQIIRVPMFIRSLHTRTLLNSSCDFSCTIK